MRRHDIEIVRLLKGGLWAKPVIAQIASGSYRVERFTLRPSYDMEPGSRVVTRSGTTTLHVADLTEVSNAEDAAAAQ